MIPRTQPLSLTDRESLQRLAKRFGVRPSKRHSQNFLLDASVVQASTDTANIHHGDWVLEVGPGFGVLTEALLRTGADVTAFEIDERLASALMERFRSEKHLSLVVGDFFRWFREHQKDLAQRSYNIVSNLPYHASSHFFETALSAEHPPQKIVVLLQLEVAERIVATPGSMSLLSLAVQLYGKPRLVKRVPCTAFWPLPDVDSALLSVDDIRTPSFDTAPLFRCARMAFTGRRKQLANTLAAGFRKPKEEVAQALKSVDINPTTRPQELSVEEWRRIVGVFRYHP